MHFFPSAKNFFLISHLRIGVNKCTIMDGYFLSRMVVHGAREVTSPFLLINLFLFRMIFWVFFFFFWRFFILEESRLCRRLEVIKARKIEREN